MDFIRPVFGSRSIQFTNGEEAKYRRQRYDCYFNSSSVRGYFPLFVEVSLDTRKTEDELSKCKKFTSKCHNGPWSEK